MLSRAGGAHYFAYDPTASILAVVYEQGPRFRYLNGRDPAGLLVTREKYYGVNRIATRPRAPQDALHGRRVLE